MDRRKSLKLIVTGAAGGVLAAGCGPNDKKVEEKPKEAASIGIDRSPAEMKQEQEILAKGKFFTEQEMATLTLLCDIIIPKDEVSGSASEAKVPEWIDFICQDMPQHQTPMRGGLRWMEIQSTKQFSKGFAESSHDEQIKLVDQIAYPEKAKPDMKQGVSFFNLLRNLTATGFYTSEIGVKDVGYIGSKPTQWAGVPADVLQQYGVGYTEKDLKDCI